MHGRRSSLWTRLNCCLFALVCIVVCVACAGCDNSCVVIISNPGGQPFPNPPTCSPNKATATVNVAIHSAAPLPSTLGSASVQHIYVTIRGVQAHPSEAADADSPDWVDLTPELASQPVQVDLLAPPRGSCGTGSLGDHIVVAGVYRQIRIQLTSGQPSAIAPRENACRNAGFHCTVTAGGTIQPLLFDAEQPSIHLTADRISARFVRILPDSRSTLALEFNPYASTLRPTAGAMRLEPVISVSANTSCNSTVR
jgi:hypothetical protein